MCISFARLVANIGMHILRKTCNIDDLNSQLLHNPAFSLRQSTSLAPYSERIMQIDSAQA